jgi:hypothetical protein
LCLGREKAEASKVFFYNLLTISLTENPSPFKNSLGRTIGIPKTALAVQEAEEYKGTVSAKKKRAFFKNYSVFQIQANESP